MPKTKVIHFVNDMGRGGLEQVVMVLVQSLDPERFDAEVWCMSDDYHEVADQLREEGKIVRVLGIRSYYNPFNILKLAMMIRKHKPQIIHTHIYFASTIGRLAAKLVGVPVIVTHMHNVYLHLKRRHVMTDRFLSRFTDRIICCSRAVERFVVEDEGISRDKTMVIHNGADITRLDKPFDAAGLKRSLGIAENDFIILKVASLMEKKGHRYLFEALSKLFKDYPSVKCLLVGYGTKEEEAVVKAYAKKCGLNDRIVFLGLREDVPDILRIADLFVLSSLTEGLPLAVIEAMAVGLPVVATDVGGVKEVMEHQVTGLIVEAKNSEALYAAMKKFMDDPALAAQLGLKASQVSREKFSSQNMLRQVENLYLELLSGKGI